MEPQKFYKSNIRSNVLRQAIFTDKNVLFIVLSLVVFCIFYFFRELSWNTKFISSALLSGAVFLILTTKVDNQPVNEIMPRAILFPFKKHIEPEIKIKDNLIFTENAIVAVFKIEPVDIFLLSKDDQAAFFARIHHMFQVLQGHIQINVLTRETRLSDYNKHFDALLKSAISSEKRLNFVQSLIRDLKEEIEGNETVLTKIFYFQVTESYHNDSKRSLYDALNKLNLRVQKITGSMIFAGLEVEQVVSDDLTHYLKAYYQ